MASRGRCAIGCRAPISPGYRLEAQGPDGRAAVDVRTQGAGFELRGLLPGRWRIRVYADGYSPAERWIDVPPATRLHEPSVRSLRMELHKALEGIARPGRAPP